MVDRDNRGGGRRLLGVLCFVLACGGTRTSAEAPAPAEGPASAEARAPVPLAPAVVEAVSTPPVAAPPPAPLPPAPAPVTPKLEAPPRPETATVLRRIGPYAVLSLPVRAVVAQPELLEALSAAATASERIAWDQSHRHAVALHGIAEQLAGRADGEERGAVQGWLEHFTLSLGPYDARSGEKLPAPLPRERVDALLGAPMAPELAAFWYDPAVAPTRTAPSSGGSDPVAAAGANFYLDVTAKDLVDLVERYPRNSRVSRRADGTVFEEVWRAGRDASPGVRPSPRGRYAVELSAVVAALERARPLAAPELRVYLEAVCEQLVTGEAADLARAEALWLGQAPPIAASFGFVETDWDPRARKGLWQALVVLDDAPLRKLFETLAAAAPELEARGPWAEAHRRPRQDPRLPWPVEVYAGSGATGPVLPAELTLPNDAAARDFTGAPERAGEPGRGALLPRPRHELEPRTWLLSNVVRAVDEAMDELTLPAFASAGDQADARKYRGLVTDVQLVLDSVVGLPPWRPTGALAGKDPAITLKELSSPLEYLRRALVGLHFLGDPAVLAASACDDGCVRAAYRRLIRHETILLGRTLGARIEDEHHRALRAVVAWLNDKGAVRVDLPAAGDDRTPIGYHVDDAPARAAVAELLAEVMRVGSEGDYPAARRIFELTELPDPEVMAPLRRRVAALALPEAYAFESVRARRP